MDKAKKHRNSQSLFKGTGLLYIEPTGNFALQGPLKPVKGITDACTNIPYVILVANLTNVSVHLPKHTVLFASSNRLFSAIDPEQVEKERHHTVTTVHTTLKQTFQEYKDANDTSINEDWSDTINIPPEYAAYRSRFANMLQQFQNACDGHLEKINTVTHKVALSSPEVRPIKSVLYCSGPRTGEAQKKQTDKMLAMKVIHPTQTECASPIVFVSKRTEPYGFAQIIVNSMQ